MKQFKNDFEKAITNLKEGEIILGARVAEGGTEILINGKIDNTIHGAVLVMLLHAIYANGIKEAQEHDVPMVMAKMMAELPIMMAFQTFKDIKDDKEMLDDIMKQVGEQQEKKNDDDCDKAKDEVESEPDASNGEEHLQEDKEKLAGKIDKVFANLAPNEKKLFIELIASMAVKAAELGRDGK